MSDLWEAVSRPKVAVSKTLYHGTNVALQQGDTLRPAALTGDAKHADFDYYDSTVVYLTDVEHNAEKYALGAVKRHGGEPHVYEVRPIGLCYPDPENESGFSTDQWCATMGEIIREVPITVWKLEDGMIKRASESYQTGHQPLGDGPMLHAVDQEDPTIPDSWALPPDVYDHPERYTFGGGAYTTESVRIVKQMRGKPDALVTIYRAAPPGVTKINTGDWVAISKSYAQQHIESNSDDSWKVISAQVPARTVRNGGSDLIEWGYHGPSVGAKVGSKFDAVELADVILSAKTAVSKPSVSHGHITADCVILYHASTDTFEFWPYEIEHRSFDYGPDNKGTVDMEGSGDAMKNSPQWIKGRWLTADGCVFDVRSGEIRPAMGFNMPTSPTMWNPMCITALERLMDLDASIGRWPLVDSSTYNSWSMYRGTVVDFLRSVNEIRAEYAEANNAKTGAITFFDLYHGTCGFYADKILQSGLKPRDTSGVANHWSDAAISHEGLVYLSHPSRLTVSESAMRTSIDTVKKELGYTAQDKAISDAMRAASPDTWAGREEDTVAMAKARADGKALRARMDADPRLDAVLLRVRIPFSAFGKLRADEDTAEYAGNITEMTGMPEWMGSLGSDAVVAFQGEIPASWISVASRGPGTMSAGDHGNAGNWRKAASKFDDSVEELADVILSSPGKSYDLWQKANEPKRDVIDWPKILSQHTKCFRGIGVKVTPEVHATLFNDTLSLAERAEVAYKLVRSGSMHWSLDRAEAAGYAGMVADRGDVRIILTAWVPRVEDVITDEQTLRRNQVYGFGFEKEIPVRPGATMRLRMIEWAPGGPRPILRSDDGGGWLSFSTPGTTTVTAGRTTAASRWIRDYPGSYHNADGWKIERTDSGSWEIYWPYEERADHTEYSLADAKWVADQAAEHLTPEEVDRIRELVEQKRLDREHFRRGEETRLERERGLERGGIAKAAGTGLYWRIHPTGRPFTIEDATSTTFHEVEEGQGRVSSKGYSCFANPWHLWLYLNAMRMNGADVIGFSGERIGTGNDGEDLVIPDMAIVRRLPYDQFEVEMLSVPMPETPKFGPGWSGYGSWAQLARTYTKNGWSYGSDARVDKVLERGGIAKAAVRRFGDFERGQRVVVRNHPDEPGTIVAIRGQGNAYTAGYIQISFDSDPESPAWYPWRDVSVIAKTAAGQFLKIRDEMYWIQEQRELVQDAMHSWKGSPTEMNIHMYDEVHEPSTRPSSGSGKIMRAQAKALLIELRTNGKPIPRLYRGAGKPPEGVLGWSENRRTANRFAKDHDGLVYVLPAGSIKGLCIRDYCGLGGLDQDEREWIVDVPVGLAQPLAEPKAGMDLTLSR